MFDYNEHPPTTSRFLPLASEGLREVMFSQASCVCSHLRGGGGGYLHLPDGGGGVPHPS